MSRKHKVTLPNKPAAPTTQQGKVSATFGQLYTAFGDPGGPSRDGTMKHIWRRDIDGVLCTIYDYNEDLNTGAVEEWTVGGEALASVQLVTEALLERLG